MFKLKRYAAVPVVASALLLTACGGSPETSVTNAEVTPNAVMAQAELTQAQLEQIVSDTFQYVAMYNVTNKTVFATPSGWNSAFTDTVLKDENYKDIARPNNDTLYIGGSFDLRKDPIIVDIPAFDSDYVSLMTGGYDHIVEVPMSTTYGNGDFTQSERIAFYTDRTEGYNGEPIEGVDRVFKMTSDFTMLVFRVMPHAAEPERFATVAGQMADVEFKTLSEYQGGTAKAIDDVTFPAIAPSDAEIFTGNYQQVLQFVFDHVDLDPTIELDRRALAAAKLVGVEPGKAFDADSLPAIDSERMAAAVEKVRTEQFALMNDPEAMTFDFLTSIHLPKAEASPEPMLLVSVVGPIGQPAHQAMYPPVVTADGELMNAQHDYVIRMSADDMPPANAFWSATLYDEAEGFFIPNEHKKYSVGENTGYQLNADGGIEIHIAAEQPLGVPAANWLPINRGDENMNVIMRVYGPDLERMASWQAPVAERVN